MKRIGAIVISIISFLLIACVGVYFYGVYYFRHWFLPNTFINGINVSNQNFTVCEEIVKSTVVDRDLVIKDNDGTMIYVDGSKIYHYDNDSITQGIEYIKNSQNPYLWPKSLFVKHEYDFNAQRYLDDIELYNIIEESQLASKEKYNASNHAEITYSEENGYQMHDNTQNLLDWECFKTALLDAAVNDKGFIDLSENDIYKSVDETPEYGELCDKWEKINNTIDFEMTYKLASGEEIEVNSATVSKMLMLDSNGDIVFDEEKNEAMLDSSKVLQYVQNLSDEYDNMYATKEFKTTRDDIVSIPYSRFTTYGNLINVKAEAEELEKLILNHENPGEREPIYTKKEDHGSITNNFNGTYVEVDITNQHMYYYVDYKLEFDTDVVTGCRVNGNSTPECVCFILNKARNVTLIGPGYESFVYYWMCITSQIGIHDATWRRTFGGEIYIYGGSHGCVNTPINKMSELFSMMEIGTPVVVHQ